MQNPQHCSLQTGFPKRSISDYDFYDWLRGFTDGEGSFQIILYFEYGKWTAPVLKYALYLHKDDAPLLNYIQNRLKLGKVYIYDHFASLIISNLNELL